MIDRETDAQRADRIAAALAKGGAPLDITRPATDDEIRLMRRETLRQFSESAATLTNDEKMLAYWHKVEDNALVQLSNHDLPAAMVAEYHKAIAQSLAAQGRFREAGNHDPASRLVYEELAAAVERADDAECSCEDRLVDVFDKDGNPAGQRRMPHYGLAARFWSEKHNGFVNLVRCHYCGDTNATQQMPKSLQAKFDAESTFPQVGKGADVDVFGV